MMLLMALMTQIFLLCYFGNEVIIRSEEISSHMFASNWPEITTKNKKFKSTMIVFQERLKRKTQVLVALLFPFSLDTFSKVIYECIQQIFFFKFIYYIMINSNFIFSDIEFGLSLVRSSAKREINDASNIRV